MNIRWVSPKIIVGNTAKGDYYYHRQDIVDNIWEEIEKGNNALIAAPRRVGKSSVMVYMAQNCPAGYKCIFENVQGIKSEAEFYKRFYELIITCLNGLEKTGNWFRRMWKEHGIEEISIDGKIKFKEGTLNYLEEINHLLPKLNNNKDIKIVLFIDELPEVLHKLYKTGKKNEAAGILENFRRWRQEDQFKNLRLVLAGSIGLQYVVKTIQERTTDINDFNRVDFEALTDAEAAGYLIWATDNNATVQYDAQLATHLLSKIQYHVPYFINLMLDEINKTARKNNNPAITNKSIDNSFNSVVKHSDHFKDWKNRLYDYMQKEEADFLNNVLTHIAHKNSISVQKIHDIATVHNKQTEMMELISGLEKDGYITERNRKYIFLSPFLKAFWKHDNPIYNA